jgi:myo-inositol catabolism protein IolS
LKQIAETKGIAIANLASAWLLAQEGVDSIILGGKRLEQVKENVKASDITFLSMNLKLLEK